MTRQPSSFLVRVTRSEGDVCVGSVTSIRGGEHTGFASLSEMVRIITRLASGEGSSQEDEEDSP